MTRREIETLIRAIHDKPSPHADIQLTSAALVEIPKDGRPGRPPKLRRIPEYRDALCRLANLVGAGNRAESKLLRINDLLQRLENSPVWRIAMKKIAARRRREWIRDQEEDESDDESE